MKKYGKKYGDIAHLKQSFIAENQEHLAEHMRIAENYMKQPRRTICKVCGEKLNADKVFVSHGINYYICDNCGHVNGEYLETLSFTESIYEKGDLYIKGYGTTRGGVLSKVGEYLYS